ncbi:hypothetical protein ATK86_2231 [Nocardia fluminea]|uniref:Uncharacterized protein n=1 Tax=Nocardia fluminea TaxID=134984 RepID=A0A2N3V8D3_9NOCA|nr:hypothetical protein ATK86_2231 [Nocardia fluminea]
MPVIVGSGVSADQELVAISQSIFHIMLVLDMLEAVEPLGSLDSGIREAVERCRCIGASDAVAQFADVVHIQVGVAGRQSELFSQQFGESGEVGVGRRAVRIGRIEVDGHVSRCRVADRDQVDHHPVARQELLASVEVQVDGALGLFQERLDDRRIEAAGAGYTDADSEHRNRRGESGGKPAPCEAAAAVWVGDLAHASVGLLGTQVLARCACLIGVVYLL